MARVVKYICDVCGREVGAECAFHTPTIAIPVGYRGDTKLNINVRVNTYQANDIICAECTKNILIEAMQDIDLSKFKED